MEINVGGTSIGIPDDLVDCEDFVLTAIKVAPNAVHVRGDEIDVRMNWNAGELSTIGKRLKSYERVVQIAENASCKKMGSLPIRLAEMYLSPDLWIETEFEFNIQSSMLKASASILNDLKNAQEETRVFFEMLEKEIKDDSV